MQHPSDSAATLSAASALASTTSLVTTTEQLMPNQSQQQLQVLLSKLASMLGHAVAPHRFASSTDSSESRDCSASVSLATDMWLLRFPEGEVSRLDDARLATEFPALWIDPEEQQGLLLRGRLAGDVFLTETADGQVSERPLAFIARGDILVLSPSTPDATQATQEALHRSASDWFKHALWQRKQVFIDGALATVAANAFAMVTALYTMQVYDRVVPNKGYATLWVLTIGVVLAIGLELLMRQLRARHVDRACKSIDEELSAVFFGQAMSIRMDCRPGNVGTFASQIRQFESVRNFLSSASLYVIADVPFALVFVAIIGLLAGPLALIPLAFIPLALLVGLAFKWPISKHMGASVEESNRKNGLLYEMVGGIESIKAAGAEWKVQQRWAELTRTTGERELHMRDLSTLSGSLTNTFQQISYVVLIAAGALAIGSGDLTVGGLIACSIISGRALSPIAQVSSFIVQWQHAKVALKTLDQIMALPRDEDPAVRYLVPQDCKGRLQLEDVKFGYDDKPVLTVPRLNIEPGERIAIVGAVGSGKSTLLKLLSGLYQPREGRLQLDGVDMRQLAPEFLRQHIGYLPQEVRLFHGTLRENLTLGLPLQTDSRILECARITGLDRVITAHPLGLERLITEGGTGLSGGQRQLMGITRLLLARPRIILLDEPSASMDMQLENQLEEQVFGQNTVATTLIVATHKPAILSQFNRIIVIDKGRIVADGPRDKILASARPPAKIETPPTPALS